MVKVFLVEDERVIREGIKRRIDWEECGLCLVGEAGDGEMAYPMIQETRPDILITDIRMPFMDGLELSELVKREQPDIKIIVISGFEEFAYASRALKIGVTDYLMKPVNSQRLRKTLLDAKKKILEEQEQKRYRDAYEQEQEKRRQAVRCEFLGELTGGRCSVSEIISKGKNLQIDLAAKAYNLILFQYESKESGRYGLVGKHWEIEEKLRLEIEKNGKAVYFDRGVEGGAILIKERAKKKPEEETCRLLGVLQQIFEEKGEYRYFAGVGKSVPRLREIPHCYEQASRAFAHRFFSRTSCVITSEEAEHRAEENIHLDRKRIDRSLVERFLKEGSRAEIPRFVEGYFHQIRTETGSSLILRQYILIDSNVAVLRFLEKIGGEREKVNEYLSDMQELASSVVSEELAKSHMSRTLELCLSLRDGFSYKRSNEMVEMGKDFIMQHFQDEDISLNKVAAYVKVTPNHFSRAFHQQEGKTFVEYLTEIRMRQARDMLRCTGLKITEIGKRLGYKDPHYFYYLFKKTVGCTPGDYRMGNVG